MTFDWYLLFNLDEFLELDLVSRTLTVALEGVGEKEIQIVRGNEVSVIYEDVMMPIQFQGENPFLMEGDAGTYAVYEDDDSNIYLGIEVSA